MAKAENSFFFPNTPSVGLTCKTFSRKNFVNECRVSIEKIAEQCHNIAALVGGPNLDLEDGILMNAMFFMYDGEVRGGVNKTILSDYDVFDESRYFIPGESNTPLRYKNQNIRVIFDEYESNMIEKTDTIIVHVGSTPFTTKVCLPERKSIIHRTETEMPAHITQSRGSERLPDI